MGKKHCMKCKCINCRRTQDFELAHLVRKTFADRYQSLLSDSLRAQDGRPLQSVLAKLNEEEKQSEWDYPCCAVEEGWEDGGWNFTGGIVWLPLCSIEVERRKGWRGALPLHDSLSML